MSAETDVEHSGTRHQPGTMDITEQEKTFAGFLTVIAFHVIAVPIVLIFLLLING